MKITGGREALKEIVINNLKKRYEEKVIFNDFSMSVEKGEMIAIVGESGCGKSTLLNIIGLLEPIDSGEVVVCGKANIKPDSIEAGKMLRNNISYLFQNYALVEDETVKYNLHLALQYAKKTRREKEESIRTTLASVGLNGYENKKIYKLSGGEQQRVAIARCMLKPGTIVLADEPTGSVDEKNREVILNLIKQMNDQGKTIIIVTHDPYVAKKCERIIYLKNENRKESLVGTK